MSDTINNDLSVTNTRAINSLIFQLLATRQALHALLSQTADSDAVTEQFRAEFEHTLNGLASEPEHRYLFNAYCESGRETLAALGHPADDID